MNRITAVTILTVLGLAVPTFATANGPMPGCPEPPQPCQTASAFPTRHPVPAVPDGRATTIATPPSAPPTPRSTFHPIHVPNAGGGPG